MKRILFDENMPRLLRRDLPELEIRTAQEEGWSGLKNGELLRVAEGTFAVLVTADKRLQFQQNIGAFNIAVVVVSARSTRVAHMRPLVEQIRLAIEKAEPGTFRSWPRAESESFDTSVETSLTADAQFPWR